MNQNRAKKLWPIIKAFGEGGSIQFLNEIDEWEIVQHPIFSEEPNRYRIKPEPKLVPFTFEDRDLFKDKWVVINSSGYLNKIIGCGKTKITIGENSFTYEEAFKYFHQENGEAFGKYTEE